MPDIKTLSEFIVERQADFPGSTGDLSSLLTAFRLAAKIVSREANKAGLLSDILGAAGNENVQGEEQQKLDVYANNLFSIYQRISSGPKATLEDFLQPGTAQVAAGYIVYGSSTMLVYTTGHGVNGFTLDPSIGTFCLSHPGMTTPTEGSIYSVNEGNYFDFSDGLRGYIDSCKKQKMSARYIGSLVADFHRNVLKGGIYLYPAAAKAPNGKLRLLYEANPLAMIVEQAGGMASDGITRILDLKPTELHQRCPLYIGSKTMVEKAMKG